MLVSTLLLLSAIVAGAETGVTTTSDKTEYFIGETIRFTQVGAVGIPNHYILPEDDVPILLTPDSVPPWFYRRCTSETISIDSITTSNIVCPFRWHEIYGLNACLTNFAYSSESEFPFTTNVSLIGPEKLDTKFVYIVIDFIRDGEDIRNEVLTKSNPFTFKLNDINIALDKTSYVHGETMELSFHQSNLTNMFPTYDTHLYLKVYEVPFSYEDDLLQFNNAKQVKYVASETKPSLPIDKQLITWQKSGQFQLVLFQKYYQVVMAISDIFTARSESNLSKFNVSLNNRTYYPHQYIEFDVTTSNMINEESLGGREVTFTFLSANATRQDLSDPTKILDSFTQPWTSRTSSEPFYVINTMVKRGFYKVIVSISAVSGGTNFAKRATKAFRVVKPLITMTTFPNRRRFIQGEVIDFDFYNPYFDFDLARNEYRGHISYVVDATFPNPSDMNPVLPDVHDYLPLSSRMSVNYQNLRIVLPPGQYKVAIFRQISGTRETFMTSVPDSYFTVVPNTFTLTTDKEEYTKGESILAELSSLHNITLSAMPPITWELTIKENDDPSSRYIFSSSGSFDQSSSSTTKLSSTIPISWDDTGVFYFGTANGFAKKEFVIR